MNKTASTAAIRAFRKNLLSEGGLKKVVDFTKKITEIKPLGIGGYQRAALVIDPKYGKSVMKHLLNKNLSSKTKLDINPIRKDMTNRNREFKALKYLKKISKGKDNIQIAQIKGRKGPIFFQEYVKRSDEDISLLNNLLNARDKKDFANRFIPLKDRKNLTQSFYDDIIKKENDYLKAGEVFKKRIKFNKETELVIKRFMKKYPHASDMRRGNQVGGKMIDFEPFIRDI